MTRRLPSADPDQRGKPVRLLLEGKPVRGYDGETVAAALYASGHRVLSRSLKYHRPRAFFCLQGHCGACLMRIGGVPNLRACMEPCRDNLEIEAQNAYPSADLDVLEAVDWLFPKGMDHHRLMTGSRVLNAVVNKIVRQLSGLGQLPDRPPGEIPAVRDAAPEIVVIGGGPAGLAAATAAARAGADTLLVDEHAVFGGSMLADPRYGPEIGRQRAEAATRAGARLHGSSSVIAYYPEDSVPVLAVATPDGLLRVRARRYVYATGGYAVNRLFANNDRPGVVAARAVGRLLVSHRIQPAHRICLVGDDEYARALEPALEAAGCEVFTVDDNAGASGAGTTIRGVRGRTWVTGVVIADRNGKDPAARLRSRGGSRPRPRRPPRGPGSTAAGSSSDLGWAALPRSPTIAAVPVWPTYLPAATCAATGASRKPPRWASAPAWRQPRVWPSAVGAAP